MVPRQCVVLMSRQQVALHVTSYFLLWDGLSLDVIVVSFSLSCHGTFFVSLEAVVMRVLGEVRLACI